jgi:uncharacterized repeat protein (TIGR04042 family)
MPIMHFDVRWPDATESHCYSPSLVIKDYLVPGRSYPLPEFLERTTEALNVASERVRAKFGFACSAAMDQLGQIELMAAKFSSIPEAQVLVLAFHE